MSEQSRSKIVGWIILGLLAAGLAGGAYGIHRIWRTHETADRAELTKERQWAISRVQASGLGGSDIRTKAASEFLGEQSEVDSCDWSGVPLWHGSRSNPNWVSNIKNSDGFRLTCDVEAKHGSDSDFLSFNYDWSSDWGVTAISWNYTPDYSDSQD